MLKNFLKYLKDYIDYEMEEYNRPFTLDMLDSAHEAFIAQYQNEVK